MSEHHLTAEGIRRAQTILWRRSLMFFVILEGFVLYLTITKMDSIPFTLGVMGLMAVVLGYGLNRGNKRAAEQLNSYALTLGDDCIRRAIRGVPDVEIARNEVTSIEERQPGGLTVYGRDRKQSIGINDQVEGYPSIREHLAAWRPFDQKR